MRKSGGINKAEPSENTPQPPEDELKFILWKANLNKELIAFWRSMTK